jgi:hypothetical protein
VTGSPKLVGRAFLFPRASNLMIKGDVVLEMGLKLLGIRYMET